MSRILVNALSAQLGGGQTHLLNIFQDQENIWKNDEIIFLTSESNTLVFEKNFGKDRVWNIGSVGNNFFSRTIWENLHLSKMAIEKKIDLVFLAAGLAPFCMTKKSKWVAISHNLLPFSWKSIFNSGRLGLSIKLIIIRFAQIWTFKRCDGVIFISNYAKKIISSFLNKKINDVVIPSGVHHMFYDKQPSPNKRAYILYVSTFFEYKHQKEVLIAFKNLKNKNNFDCDLIFIGNDKGSYGDECKKLCRELRLESCTKFLGNIAYTELPAYMQNSLFNIFASDCENCPNIVLEYLASGSPVLCSSSEPMPEFGKTYVNYFDLSDQNDLLKQMEIMLQNRAHLSPNKLDEVRALYSWKVAALSMKKFFEKIQS